MRSKFSNIIYPEVHFKDVLIFLWRGIRKSWLSLFLIIFGIGSASALEVAIPLYYKHFFDALSSGQDKAIIVPQLFHFIFIILAFHSSAWVCWRIGSFASASFQAKSMASLRQQAYDHLLYHSYGFFANNFTGALVQRVGRYARAFERFADRITWNLLPITVRIAGVVIVTWSIKPALSILIIGWAFLYMAINYFYSIWRLKYNIKMAEADSRTTAVLADSITNQNNIDIFSQQKRESENFKEVTGSQAKIN